MTSGEISPELWDREHDVWWWNSWWSEDYSWDGLKKKSWAGYSVAPDRTFVPSAAAPPNYPKATLQDYWRDEEQNLVHETGHDGSVVRRWTRLHLPTMFRDGSPTAKRSWSDADWLQIEGLLETRLKGAKALQPGKEDTRAQYQGVVVRTLPNLGDAALNLCAASARFVGDVDFSGYIFGPNLDLRSAAFAGTTSWKKTRFEGVVNFDSAQFCGASSFEANFADTAWFLSAQFGGGKTSFSGAVFKDAFFSNAHFFAETHFANSTSHQLNFSAARFWLGVSFDRAVSSMEANFKGTIFGQKDKTKAESTFAETQFSGPALFNNAIFWTETFFTAARFDDIAHRVQKSFLKLHRFEGTSHTFGAHFDGAFFHERVNFEGAAFLSDAIFNGAHFIGGVEFDRATFSGDARFDSTNFNESRRVSFQSANFERPVIFKNTKWPVEPGAYSGTFRDVTFPRLSEFSEDDTPDSSSPFCAFAMFDGTRFEGEARLSRDALRDDRGFNAAFDAARHDDRHLRALENGCRALKVASENFRDRTAEQTFYRYELTCRRRQKTTAMSERAVSWLYDRFSNYGTSTTRPLGIILGVWLAFAILYWLMALSLPRSPIAGLTFRPFAPIHSTVFDTLRLSAHVIFAPFAIWNGNFGVSAFDDALLKADPAIALGVRLVATLESILAAVLLFLSVLAVRRRFQIN